MDTQIVIGNKPVWMRAMTGRIADEKKWTETHIRSTGGGGFVYNGSGYIGPNRISSVNTTRHEFWIVSEDGQEQCVSLPNSALRIRPGQLVTVLWGAAQGKQTGPFLMIQNHANGEKHWLARGSAALNSMGLSRLLSMEELMLAGGALLLGLLISHLSSNVSALLTLGSIGFLVVRYKQKKDAALETIMQSCSQLLDSEVSALRNAFR